MFVGCSGDSTNSDTASSFSPVIRADDALLFAPVALLSLEKDAGFETILPAYIPKDDAPYPRIQRDTRFDKDKPGIEITYYPREGKVGVVAPLIDLRETKHEYLVGERVTRTPIDGKDVQVVESTNAAGTFIAYWKQSDVYTEAAFTWADQKRLLVLNDDMKAVAKRVVESIISQEGRSD